MRVGTILFLLLSLSGCASKKETLAEAPAVQREMPWINLECKLLDKNTWFCQNKWHQCYLSRSGKDLTCLF